MACALLGDLGSAHIYKQRWLQPPIQRKHLHSWHSMSFKLDEPAQPTIARSMNKHCLTRHFPHMPCNKHEFFTIVDWSVVFRVIGVSSPMLLVGHSTATLKGRF